MLRPSYQPLFLNTVETNKLSLHTTAEKEKTNSYNSEHKNPISKVAIIYSKETSRSRKKMSSSLELACSEYDSLPIHRFCVYLRVTSHALGVICLNTISLKKVSSSHVDSHISLSALSRTVHIDTSHCIPSTMNSFLILGTIYVHIWNLLWKHLSKALPRRLYKMFP